MTPNCAFLLENDQPCRCPALHGQLYCRHHTPEARARRHQPPALRPRQASPEPPDPDAPPTRAELSAYWRMHHRYIQFGDAEFLGDARTMILNALAEHAISHRSAGRLLALIADRSAQLERDALKAKMDALHANLLDWNHRQSMAEAPANYPVSVPGSQISSFEGSRSYFVSR